MGTELTDFIGLLTHLPAKWQIIFAVVFFLIPKIVQIIGGNVVLKRMGAAIWSSIMGIIKRYQARKQREIEDQGLTDAYTRTLVVESLSLFSTRIRRMDHKINYILLLLEPEANIEEVEMISPRRRVTETAVYHQLHERLSSRKRDTSP